MVLFDCQPHKMCMMVKCNSLLRTVTSLLTMEVNVCISVYTFVFNKAWNMHIFPCGNTHHLCYIVTEHIICPGITCIIPLMAVISCNKLTFPSIRLLLLSQTGRHHGCFQMANQELVTGYFVLGLWVIFFCYATCIQHCTIQTTLYGWIPLLLIHSH